MIIPHLYLFHYRSRAVRDREPQRHFAAYNTWETNIYQKEIENTPPNSNLIGPVKFFDLFLNLIEKELDFLPFINRMV